MYQIDVATAAGSLPVPAAAGNPGFFTDGNPGTGTPATIVPADFLNMVMQELINVVNEGGIPLSKTSYTQVRDAIANMIAAGGGGGGSGTVTAVTGIAPINSSGGVAPAISISAATAAAAGSTGATANTGTVRSVTVVSANGVSATVANQGTTPALTISLGAITPSSVSSSGTVSGTSLNLSAGATITGAVTATGGFQKGSSIKVKTRLRKLGYGLADLLKIKTQRGQYKKRFAKDGRTHLFVLAEQLKEVIPEAVYEHEGSTPTVDYMELVPVLIAAVQELAGRVRVLEAQR